MSENSEEETSEKEKKYKYYFWLDEMIMDLWSQYIDFVIDEKPTEVCNNKIKLITMQINK